MKQLLHLMKETNRIRRLFRLPSWYFLVLNYLVHMQAIGSLLWVCAFSVFFSCIVRRDKWVEGFG
jgi:hypothetical protein